MGYQEPKEPETKQEVSEEDPNKKPGTKTTVKKPEDKKREEYVDLGEGLEEEYLVVKELPVQQARQIKDEKTGKITNLLTTEEALTSLISKVDKGFEGMTGGL